MKRFRACLSYLLCVFLMGVPGYGQNLPKPAPGTPAVKPDPNVTQTSTINLDTPQVPKAEGTGFVSSLTRPYRQAAVAPINLTNSGRLEALIRAGKIYLSLEDTIALALENNLDIELARYTPQLAQVDLLRAQSGGLLRGVPTAIRQTQNSAVSQSVGGFTGGGGGSGTSATSGTDTGVGGTVITQTGVAVPSLDPTFFFGSSYNHFSRPQSNTITTGTTAVAIDNSIWQMGYQQNFLTGTQFSYGWTNPWTKNNNPRSDLNPTYTPQMNAQISQRLLQGYGIAVNNRNIRVAKNDIRVSDLTFKQQVMTTVAGVVNLYWDLVSFNQDYKVKLQALQVAQKFYEDNKKQVEIGTLAPIEIVRAEARVAQAQLDVTNAETAVLQQETILKNALSKTGVASPTLQDARIIPTDALELPVQLSFTDLKPMTEMAIGERPDLQQTKISIDNTKIAMAGSRSQLLPSLDVQATFQNNSLAGSQNTVPPAPGTVPIPNGADPYFIGGYGTALGQIMRRNFPDYSIGFQLNIPLRNRTAQADYIRDQLTLRQQELNAQKQVNDVRVSVQNALVAVIQAKARHDAAVKERQLQEQTLDATNKKYALGAATAFEVVQTQRDLAQAQGNEVSALANYSRARVQLELSTAQVLKRYSVLIDDARAGKSSKPMPPVQN